MIGGTDKCFICWKYGKGDIHHIFGGPNRKLSDEDGLTVNLCRECHMKAHRDKALTDMLHQTGQREYEKTNSREEFMKRYGRNYI